VRAFILLLLLLPLGCPTAEPREVQDLIEATAWTIMGPAEDPFTEHRAAAKRTCNQGGFSEDPGVLEIDTQTCPYVSASQPILADVLAGDELNLLAWHQVLASVDPNAQGHMAFLLDGEALWELVVDIPASAEVYNVFLPVERDIAAGSEVVVHVHNHGGNNWAVAHLRALPPNDE